MDRRTTMYRMVAHYGLAVAVAAAGLLLRLVFECWTGPGLPVFITFFPMVMLAALVGGFGPGLVATLASALMADYWIVSPHVLFRYDTLVDSVGLVLFAGMGVLMSAVAGLYRGIRGSLEELVEARTAELDRTNTQLQQANIQLQQEIDEHQYAKKILRENEARLRLAQKAANAGAWEWDLQTSEHVWSEELWQLYGVRKHSCQPSYEAWQDTIHPDDRAMAAKAVKDALSRGTELVAEWRVQGHDGEDRWLMSRGQPLRDAHGTVVRYIGIVMDITSLKRVERALQTSEGMLKRAQEIAHLGSWEFNVETNRIVWSEEACRILGIKPQDMDATYNAFLDRVHPDDRAAVDAAYLGSLRGNADGYDIVHRVVRGDTGAERIVHQRCQHVRDATGKLCRSLGTIHDITEQEQTGAALRRIEWLLAGPADTRVQEDGHGSIPAQSYGDLTRLNRSRLILDAVGKQALSYIADGYLDLLDTSTAVYEKNGDYALGIFTSGWCQFMDQASRTLCVTDDNQDALASGTWHCHESCWTKASKVAIETGQPVDIECAGGIRLHAVPIRAGGEIVGSINFGYGDPPRDPAVQRMLAAKYGVTLEALQRHAAAYETRPPFIIEVAKRRLDVSARLIGEIVEHHQAEEILRHAKEEWELTFNSVPDLIAILDATHHIVRVNRAMAERLGRDPDACVGTFCYESIHGTACPPGSCPHKKTMADGLEHKAEIHEPRLDGDFLVTTTPLRGPDGRMIGSVHVARDITEQKRAEARLIGEIAERREAEKGMEAALRDKSVLLQELYHRVKNNMHLVVSMLNLQSAKFADPATVQAFKETQDRILSMALVHEKLYRSGNLSEIDLKDYFNDLLQLLSRSCQGGHPNVTIASSLEPVQASIDSAIPCGLIVSELVTNAFKHAFPAGRKGIVTVRVRPAGDEGIELLIADDGTGLPEGFDFRSSDSHGLQSVIALVEHQLSGRIEHVPGPGTAFQIVFKEPPRKTRL